MPRIEANLPNMLIEKANTLASEAGSTRTEVVGRAIELLWSVYHTSSYTDEELDIQIQEPGNVKRKRR